MKIKMIVTIHGNFDTHPEDRAAMRHYMSSKYWLYYYKHDLNIRRFVKTFH